MISSREMGSGLDLVMNMLRYDQIPGLLNEQIQGAVCVSGDFYNVRLLPYTFSQTPERILKSSSYGGGDFKKVAILDFSKNLEDQLAELKENLMNRKVIQ